MTARLAFTIPGKPFAKGRPRTTARAYIDEMGKPRAIVTVYTPAATREGEATISRIARAVMTRVGRGPTDMPIKLRVLCVYAAPASWPKRMRELAAAGNVVHTQKPDFDNLAKVIDALNTIVWTDDCIITDATISKRFGAVARTDIVIEPVDMTGKVLAPGPERTAKKARANSFDRPVTRDLFVGKGGR